MKFEYRRSGRYWYFVIVASNGQVLVDSELYTRKASATKAINLIKKGAADAPITEEK